MVESMRIRRSTTLRRRRRRRFLAQLLASLGISLSGVAGATDLAYYADHPAESPQVITISDHQTLVTAQPPLVPAETEAGPPAPQPLDDPAEDDFLSQSPSDLEAPPVQSDVDAVVDGAAADPPPPPPPVPVPTPSALQSSLSPSLGLVAASYSASPNMMGDLFGLNLIGSIMGATVALAGGERRFKVSENVSPIPQDRIFFNYNHFHNALTDINGDRLHSDRFTFGVEKTFCGGLASVEARLPFSSGVDSRQTFGNLDTRQAEFGNLALAFKANLLSGQNWILAGGTTMTLPTGDDFEITSNFGAPQLLVQNDSVHLAPFLGYLVVPNDWWFAQGFIQADFDLNGNDVFSFGRFEGVLQDQNLMFIDASIGHWLFRNCDPCSHLQAVAAIAELHYTTTLNDTDALAGVRNPFNRMDIVNATGGLAFRFQSSSLRIGAAAPITTDEEALFDSEIIVQFNRFF